MIEIDLEVVVVVLLSSSGGVQPNLGVAQDREEVGPCNQTQTGTFLEHKRPTEKVGGFKVKGGYSLCGQLVTQQRQKKTRQRPILCVPKGLLFLCNEDI